MKSLIAFGFAAVVSMLLLACGEQQPPKQPEVKAPAPVPATMHEQTPVTNTKHEESMPVHTSEHPDTNTEE